jgi:hypothetical protein
MTGSALVEVQGLEPEPVMQQNGQPSTGSPPAPTNLTGQYDEVSGWVNLTWEAPLASGDLEYQVYRDGALLASTVDTNFTDVPDPLPVVGAVPVTYYVTASYAEGRHEPSPPSNSWSTSTPICAPLIISSHPDDDPPVSYGIDHACIPDTPGARTLYDDLMDTPLPVSLK